MGVAPTGFSMERMNAIDDIDLERECEAWDWARTAGVSAEDLREALRNAPGGMESVPPVIAKAA